jgi:TolB protein
LAPISLAGQIAFERTVDGNTDIYLMNLDRTGLVRLTDDPAVDVNPSWSPDGQRIVFRRVVDGASDMFVMNADGSDPTRLTASPESERDGRFSPDAQSIAFWRSGDVAAELRLLDPDGSNDRPVARFEGTFAAGIGWTADGRAILFNKGVGRTNEIVRIDLASKAMTTLTNRPEDDGRFALSNDGSTVAFQSDRLPAGIYLMGVDGSDLRHLAGLGTTGSPASWSPDGRHLVSPQPDGWLYLIGTDAGEVTRWTDGGLEVAWRP